MNVKPISIVAWLAAGHALLLALTWGLLNVPESNVAMLGLSAAILVLLLVLAAVVEVTTMSWLSPGQRFAVAVRGSVGAVPAVLVAIVVFLVLWWLASRLSAWHHARWGEIDAWLISTFGTTSTQWLHRTIDAVVYAIRAVVAVSLVASVLAAQSRGGLRAVSGASWIRLGLAPRQVAFVALAVVLLVTVPWRAVYWRPRLPPTWIEPMMAGIKLLAIYVSINVAWMLVLAYAGSRWDRVAHRE